MNTGLRYLLFVGGVAIHLWTVWIAWSAKGIFAGLFTLTVPFLGEAVWAGWLTWQAGTPWLPYVQVLLAWVALAVIRRIWLRRLGLRQRDAGSVPPAETPDLPDG